jgi:hypothetical protein
MAVDIQPKRKPKLIPTHDACDRCEFSGNVFQVGNAALCIACVRMLKPELFDLWCKRVAVELEYRFET